MHNADSQVDHPGSPLSGRPVPGWLAAGGGFLLLGFVINAVVITAWLDWGLVWMAFLHHNPDLSVSSALPVFVLTPIGGVMVASALAPLAVVTGAIVMAGLILVLGALPFWTVIPVIPLCVFAFELQNHLTGRDPWAVDPAIVAAQIPFVLSCWFFYRVLASPASPEREKSLKRVLYLCCTLVTAAIVTIAGLSVLDYWKPWHPEVAWSPATGLPKIAFANEWQARIPSGYVSWSPDGRKILTLSSYSDWLTVRDPAGRLEQERQYPSLPSPYSRYFASNAQEIFFSGNNKTDLAFSVVDIASGRTVFQEHALQPNKPGRDAVTFAPSPDGSVLAAAHDNIPGHPISLYETKTWQKLSTIEAPAAQDGMGRLVFSADGSRLAFVSSGKFFVVDARTGQSVSTIQIPARAGAFALSPDNTMVAVETIGSNQSGLMPNGIGIFRLSDGVQIASHAPSYPGPNCPENREDCALSSPILWAPTGRCLIFPDGYHRIRIWNPFSGNGEDATIQTRYFEGAIALSPDGNRLAISNGDFVSVFDMGG
ncbi:MAG TPA: WD40 repeat domain-containing protein [Xanthobacteraceae bacterium]|jgi:DNA-binding beta-propeller fold protein YncE